MQQRTSRQSFVDWVMGRAPQALPVGGPRWVPTRNRIGICVSGGGIRSASYCLGALQALQERGVLQKAEYLASVSGGGYIAGAMTMMATSEDQSLVSAPYPDPYAPGSPEERYLRNHSSYLAPDGAGMLRLLLRIVLGLLINLIFLGSILVPFGRASGLLAERTRGDLSEPLAIVWPLAWTVMVGLFILGTAFLFLTALRRLGGRQDRIISIAYALLIPALILFLFFVAIPNSVLGLRTLTKALGEGTFFGSILGTSGGTDGPSGVARLYSIAVALGIPALVGGAILGVLRKRGASIALFLAGLIAPTLIALTVIAVANDAITPPHDAMVELGWFGVSGIVFSVLYFAGDLTASSMHPFYKRRLSSAFALKRQRIEGEEPPEDIRAAECPYTERIPLTSTAVPPSRRWPKWVACAAANISDGGLTPPGRKAVSFTFDSEWIGGPEVGYVPTRFYESVMGGERAEDVSVPATIAISGAALAPSMGTMTRPSLTFLLALLNARLGVWLPNPRLIAYRHQKAAMKELEEVSTEIPPDSDPVDVTEGLLRTGPRANFTWLIREMFGMNKGKASFLYVTDGGHWENLGLVELLRRGCTEVYCFDAAGDKEDTFFTLGQAVSMARSELGIEIELDPDDILPAGDAGEDEVPGYSRKDHVYGTFRHTRATPSLRGRIVFAKAAVVEDAPWDVRAYKLKDPQFPNHSLLAQMFADQTFESYRRLGFMAGQGAERTMEREKKRRA